MIGCWLLVFGCRLVATILPTTKYQQPITLNFFFVFYIDILFSKQPKQPIPSNHPATVPTA